MSHHEASTLDDTRATQERVTPLPKLQIAVICLLFAAEAFHYCFLFPFVGFMVLDFGLVKEERDAG